MEAPLGPGLRRVERSMAAKLRAGDSGKPRSEPILALLTRLVGVNVPTPPKLLTVSNVVAQAKLLPRF